MARQTRNDRLLPANAKAIQKAAKSGGPTIIEYRIEGARGLVLHVLPSGTATWYFHYDKEVGKRRERRKWKIGRLDEVTLTRALDKAEELRPKIRQGADPVSQKSVDRALMTFRELANERLKNGDPLRPSTKADYQYLLDGDVLPVIGDLPAKAVERADVIKVLNDISNRGAKRRADTARAVISSIYSFGLDRDLVTENPASGIRNRHDYQPRDVTASPAEIRQLWLAMDADEAAMSPAITMIVKLALLTGLRRTEIAGSRKAELDLDSTSPHLTIPRGRAKNRNAHRVPLTSLAASLFRQAVKAAGDNDFVFPNKGSLSHIAPRSVSKAMERTRAKLGIKEITMHDLRRTAGTYMSQYGVPKDVRERVLNHGGMRRGSITDSVYNHYDYDAEKRAALELWADALAGIVEGHPKEIRSYHARLKGTDKVTIA